jgi:signal transduction histidine kinase
MRLTLARRGLILVGIPLLLQAVIFGSMYALLNKSQETMAQTVAARHMVMYCNDLIIKGINIGRISGADDVTVNGGHKKALNREQLRQMIKAFNGWCGDLRDARTLTSDTELIALNDQLQAKATSVRAELVELLQLAKSGELLTLLRKTSQFQQELRAAASDDTLTTLYSMFLRAREQFEQSTTNFLRQSARERTLLMLASGIAAVLGISLRFFFSNQISRRLFVIKTNSIRFSNGEDLLPPQCGSDEIADVDRTFHLMAAEINRAKQRERAVRRLEDQVTTMVTHDLRSPLQTLSTFLAIADKKVTDPAQRKSIEQATQDVARMSALIQDVLEI